MNFFRKYPKLIIVLFVIALNVAMWSVVQTTAPDGILTIAFLDVGQGDAIFIQSPTRHQILVDGGPGNAVLGELRKVMPWYDRSIDSLLITNPDKDHIAGFIPVLDRYRISQVIEPNTENDTDVNRLLHRKIDAEFAGKILAKRGQVIDLGGGALLYILFPDRDLRGTDSNTGSVIAKLVYGSTAVMLTGDAPSATLEYVASLDGEEVDSDILKAGHHGSRTSASESFVAAVSPAYAVITAGRKNRYGHPHKETTELFKKQNVPVLGTYERGTIIFQSDGERLWIK